MQQVPADIAVLIWKTYYTKYVLPELQKKPPQPNEVDSRRSVGLRQVKTDVSSTEITCVNGERGVRTKFIEQLCERQECFYINSTNVSHLRAHLSYFDSSRLRIAVVDAVPWSGWELFKILDEWGWKHRERRWAMRDKAALRHDGERCDEYIPSIDSVSKQKTIIISIQRWIDFNIAPMCDHVISLSPLNKQWLFFTLTIRHEGIEDLLRLDACRGVCWTIRRRPRCFRLRWF